MSRRSGVLLAGAADAGPLMAKPYAPGNRQRLSFWTSAPASVGSPAGSTPNGAEAVHLRPICVHLWFNSLAFLASIFARASKPGIKPASRKHPMKPRAALRSPERARLRDFRGIRQLGHPAEA